MITESEKKRISDSIRMAESRTAGEIFCVVARHSGNYRLVPITWAAASALFTPLPFIYWTMWSAATIYLSLVGPAGLLFCLGVAGLAESAPVVSSGWRVHRQVSAVPDQLAIPPNGVTLDIDPTQRFQIPDDPGRLDGSSLTPALVAKTQQFATPQDGKKNTANSPALLPLPNQNRAAPDITDATTEHAPWVTYRDGQLTIDARNSTLTEVLTLIAEKTGATIDIPPGSGLEPIVEHAGPGPANDVLAQLLNGSRYNFIIVNSPQRPSEPTRVLLSLQRGDSNTPSPTAPQPVTADSLLTSPPTTASAPNLPRQLDILTPPTEDLTPEALGALMKQKAHELRERAQQFYGPQ